ncbi:MAG: hypothetical protein GX249_00095 [Firmicutes bacterium]|nr:hypothetical protein [Bacillota bacterium]
MITQSEADRLLELRKVVTSRETMNLPIKGKKSWDLESDDGSEKFIIDVWCGKIEMTRYSTNHRYRKDIVLARVCVNNQPHMNPNGDIISEPHLHLYREGLGDKYAIPLPKEFFSAPHDIVCTTREFLAYCNVVEHPEVQQQGGLFP